jgi:plasmid stability protein
MANLTLTIDDGVLKRARIRALQQGTSVNALVREYLERYSGVADQRDARLRFLDLAAGIDARSGPRRRAWKRDQLYDRRVLR